MKSIAIHQQNDWFLVQLPGLGGVAKENLSVEIKVLDDVHQLPDYKTLRGAVIVERDLEKQGRMIVEDPGDDLIRAFDARFGTSDVKTMDDLLNKLQNVTQ